MKDYRGLLNDAQHQLTSAQQNIPSIRMQIFSAVAGEH